MPGWKREVGARLDALIEAEVPGVRKAVRWNTPFYGIQGQGWFIAFDLDPGRGLQHVDLGTGIRPSGPGDLCTK